MDRVLIRPWSVDDADAMERLLTPTVTEPYRMTNFDDCKAYIRKHCIGKDRYAIMLDGNLIGFIGITNGVLSYWLGEAYWGNGYMTEAVRKVVRKGLTAKVMPDNERCKSVLKKCGFKHIGTENGLLIYRS